MPKIASKTREEARRLFLTGEAATNAEIAARIKVKPHTVGLWRREEDWDGLRRKIDRRAAELFVEAIATDRTTLNMQHFKMWGLILSQLLEAMQSPTNAESKVRILEREASILERSQKGQRRSRGLALDGESEEQIRAEAQAELRHYIDVFIDAVKENVSDEDARERIRHAIVEALPSEEDLGTGDGGGPVSH